MAAAEDADFAGVEELSDEEAAAVEAQLFRLADDELVVAERYTEWQVRAPTLESDISLANIAQDELGHGRLWYQVLKRFGYDETDLIWERAVDDFRHSTLVEQPFAEGDWADAVVRGYLYDIAEDVRLGALEGSSFGPIRDRVGKVLAEEEYHLEYAENWLGRLAAHEDGHERLQAALDRLYPYALTLFEPVDATAEARIVEMGVREEPLSGLREAWHDRVRSTLEDVGLEVPALDSGTEDDRASPVDLPDRVGRDGDHTDHWPALLEEMTGTYEELERDYAKHVMETDE
jgi:ring-1,2-phenylacetyl-CoA epoxidase subunit PaaC